VKPVEPILVSRLFPELLAELLTLLRGLRGPDWYQPTAARAWCAKDVVAHLLDGDIRRLSVQRDHCPLPEPELPTQGCGRSSLSPHSGEGGGER
jgi:Mycothiol maleylpyruvate isomerase N-terminal domain